MPARPLPFLRLLLGLAGLGGSGAWADNGDPPAHYGPVRALSIDQAENRVLSGGFDSSLRLWRFDLLKPTKVLDGHDGPVNAVVLISGRDQALSVGDDGGLLQWDLTTGRVLRRMAGHTGKIADLAVAPDGRHAATAGWDGTVRLWSLTGDLSSRLLDLPVDYHAVIFTDGGRMLWSADRKGTLTKVNAATGEVAKRIPGNGFAIVDLALMPDGRSMVTAGMDGTLRILALENGTEQRRLVGHDGPVMHVRVIDHPDGSRLVSAGGDGRWILWDPDRRQPLRQRFVNGGPIWALAVSADGRFALTGHGDGTLRMWYLADASLIRQSGETPATNPVLAGNNSAGARVFRACSVCHALSADAPPRAGPHFQSLFGRQVGSVGGYRYSSALDEAEFVWTEERVKDLFRQGPDKYLPGTKMPVQKISNEADLEALVTFLREATRR